MAQKSDINVGMLVTLGAAGALMLVVIVIAVQAWVDYQDRAAFAADLREGPVVRPVEKLRTQQLENIGAAHFDKDGRPIAIPIDQAMQLLIDSGGKLPVAPTSPAAAPRSTGAS